jgi:hypothetical protein
MAVLMVAQQMQAAAAVLLIFVLAVLPKLTV